MMKISGILPASSRVEGVDLKSERPLRPGALSFGQPVAQRSERVSQSEKLGGLDKTDFDRTLKNTGPKSDKDIAVELSDAFFSKKRGDDVTTAPIVDGNNVVGETPAKGLSIYA